MNENHDPFNRSFESLEALADTISEVLHNPVTIEDDNHRLIAYSSHESQTDTARVATIIGRRVPEKVIRALWQDGIMQRIMESEEPVAISAIESVGLGDRLVMAIRKQHKILGYIWVLESDKRLGKEAFDKLKKAAHAATTKLLQLQVKKRKEEKGHEDFFWQLLTGHLSTSAEIREKAAALEIELPRLYRIIVLEFGSEIQDKQQQIEYMLTTTQRVSILFHTIKHNQLILLTGLNQRQYDKESDFGHFEYLFEQMQQRFGFSPSDGGSGSVYDDFILVERSYREALTVLRIKMQFPHETRNVYDYPTLGYYRFLPALLAENRTHPIENQCLKKLREYDSEHNGNLLHTLEVFLSSDSNVKAAAEALHVHINTLSYRLKRIGEIGGIDLDSMDQKVTVFLDFKINKLNGAPLL
ncbi:PucR family transcriptional regulator [Paenibacillus spongiae]|uniref:PucR family transcriptional regulator n=1 Tax=Paenibacillus spongiae TaxID=2909671 RepID=A0ABY5SGK0_9BACL|nr:PucR family transcriptional regulator [Paenibacillus spongiae]UVI33107.1 PucR family transcriptional regulator [Paenibacillus spongiae]